MRLAPRLELLRNRCTNICFSISYVRLTGEKELEVANVEGNVQYWCGMMFEFAMNRAAQLEDTEGQFLRWFWPVLLIYPKGWPSPPEPVPGLRYAQTAVFLTLDGKSSYKRAFLIEEKMDGEFVKLIHNGSPEPNVSPSETESYVKAKFLGAVQHYTFETFNRSIFLSDFQGAGDVLTDCQVMSDPCVLTSSISLISLINRLS